MNDFTCFFVHRAFWILTNSSEQSPFWEDNRSLNSQEITHIVWSPLTVEPDFISSRHLSVSWASSIQSTPHITSWRSILMLSSHLRLGLPGGLFPSDLPTKTLYALLLSLVRVTCPAHLIPLDLITRTIGEQYRSKSSFCSLLHSPVTSSLSGPDIFLSILFSNTLSVSFPSVWTTIFTPIQNNSRSYGAFWILERTALNPRKIKWAAVFPFQTGGVIFFCAEHPYSLWGSRGLFSVYWGGGGLKRLKREVTTQFYPVPRWISGAVPLFPHTPSWRTQGRHCDDLNKKRHSVTYLVVYTCVLGSRITVLGMWLRKVWCNSGNISTSLAASTLSPSYFRSSICTGSSKKMDGIWNRYNWTDLHVWRLKMFRKV